MKRGHDDHTAVHHALEGLIRKKSSPCLACNALVSGRSKGCVSNTSITSGYIPDPGSRVGPTTGGPGPPLSAFPQVVGLQAPNSHTTSLVQ